MALKHGARACLRAVMAPVQLEVRVAQRLHLVRELLRRLLLLDARLDHRGVLLAQLLELRQQLGLGVALLRRSL